MRLTLEPPRPRALRRKPELASLAVLDVALHLARSALLDDIDDELQPPHHRSLEGYVKNHVRQHIALLGSALQTYRGILERGDDDDLDDEPF